jgi:hypothetical protein
MDTEERKPRIRDRIDKIANQGLSFRDQFVVFSSERYNTDFGVDSTESGYSVTLKPTAVD